MKFSESAEGIIAFEFPQRAFIYFLIQDDNVVYVGKTKKGLSRPFHHSADKVFDSVKILPCDESNLDKTESYYIAKYKPLYNRHMGTGEYLSLLTARNVIRKQGETEYTLWDLKHDMKNLGIVSLDFNGRSYIDNNDFKRIQELKCGVQDEYRKCDC